MDISVNGQSQVPPGFRFHPTEEELLHYYLKKKVASKKIDLDVIRDVDLNKLEPWDIQEKCRIGSTPQNDWYFFSHKDKKYPTGTRTNRATAAGFWKATGRDKVIYSNSKRIGMRKTLVFYKGRAPHGQKSDWIMHEYRLDDNNSNNTHGGLMLEDEECGMGSSEDGWVVCRVFKKKNYHKAVESFQHSPTSSMDSRNHAGAGINCNNVDGGILDRILGYMGRSSTTLTTTADVNSNNNNTSSFLSKPGAFMHLPRLLENPWPESSDGGPFFGACHQDQQDHIIKNAAVNDDVTGGPKMEAAGGMTDWVALDRLVASQLNAGHDDVIGGGGNRDADLFSFPLLQEQDHQSARISDHHVNNNNDNKGNDDDDDQVYMMVSNGEDFWRSFAGSPSSSSTDPLCHLSV